MGFFFDKYFDEGAVTSHQQGDNAEGNVDSPSNTGIQQDDDSSNNMPENNDNDNKPDASDNPDENNEDSNDMTDDDMGDMGSDGFDDNSDNNDSSFPEEEDVTVDDLKAKEEELYNQLSPEQLNIKHRELKNQFLMMYDMIVPIIDRVGELSVSEERLPIIEYVSNSLAKLKNMISDYIDSVYKTKSFIENSINYNKFLAILNGINKILEELETDDIARVAKKKKL